MHPRAPMLVETREWEEERARLLGRRISELGLRIQGSPLEELVATLYRELDAKGLVFHPPVYLSDQWGCPSGVPIIGVPFYLADWRLARIEEENAGGIEGPDESMEYLRHEAGHAFNYAYRLYDRPDWRQLFGPYSRPYRERYRADPFSRDYVRHILGWYAQKHPDEDFAESFAVWLTPTIDWRAEYGKWPALRKLEFVDRVMGEIGGTMPPRLRDPAPEDLPVEAMHYTVAEHYTWYEEAVPIEDERYFDGDLRVLFGAPAQDATQSAGDFIRQHMQEVVARLSYWTGESPGVVRAFIAFLAERADHLGLRMTGREATMLIEIVAFGTAVMMNYRYTNTLGGDFERDQS